MSDEMRRWVATSGWEQDGTRTEVGRILPDPQEKLGRHWRLRFLIRLDTSGGMILSKSVPRLFHAATFDSSFGNWQALTA